jgi:hypothetical protein
MLTVLILCSIKAVYGQGLANDTSLKYSSYHSTDGGITAQKNFKNKTDMADYLRHFRTKTYNYFKKLDSIAQEKVFILHNDDVNKDLTYIVLEVYLNRS